MAFNIIGKSKLIRLLCHAPIVVPCLFVAQVDPSKSFVPLKEAFRITDDEYDKFKGQMRLVDDKTAKLLNANYVERQKEHNFQQVFKELWPNLHNQLNSRPEPPPAPKPVINYVQPAPIIITQPLVTHSCHTCCTHNAPKSDDKPSYPKWDALIQTLNQAKPSKLEEKVGKYSSHLSSYDLPFSTVFDKDAHKEELRLSTLDAKILESIKKKNDKLREQNKIEKTTDIVDGLIKDVAVLQADLKKKANELKAKEDLIRIENQVLKDFVKMSHSVRRQSRSKSRDRSASSSCSRHSSRPKADRHAPKVVCYHETRPRATCSTSALGHHHHHHRHHAIREHKPKSKHHYHGGKPVVRSSSTLERPTSACWKHTKPKVVSWQCDMNVY
jgi:hypothetical protein